MTATITPWDKISTVAPAIIPARFYLLFGATKFVLFICFSFSTAIAFATKNGSGRN